MKFIKKNWWMFAVCFIVIGAALICAAWGLGARGGVVYADESGLHITSYEKGNGQKLVVNENSLEAFSSVDVSASAEQIRLIPSDHYGLEISMLEESPLYWDITGGKLTVKSTQKSGIYLLNIDFSINDSSNYIYIYYPQNTSFDDIKISSSSGSVKISGLVCKRLSASSFSGSVTADVTLENANVSIGTSSGRINFTGKGSINKAVFETFSGSVTADVSDCRSMKISTSSGSVTAKNNGQTATVLDIDTFSGSVDASGGTWDSLKAETSSGSINISGVLKGKTVIESFSGSVKISAKGSASDYGYDLESFSGSIKVNGQRSGKAIYSPGLANAENTIKVETSSGSISLNFS